MHDVARLAKCSIATVSRFFNQKSVSRDAEQRILAAVEALAFSPNTVARSLKLKRSMMLGMIIPDITEPFYSLVVKGVEDTARDAGYSLMLFNTQEDEGRESICIDILFGRQCDGVLLIKAPHSAQHERYREKLATRPLPIVYLDRAPDAERDAVLVDNQTGARRGVEHLLKLGHRKIGIVMMGYRVSTHLERLEGYRRALADYGIPDRPEYVRQTEPTVPGAYSATLQLLDVIDPPSAIFATNARLTVGVMAAIESRQLRCPEDISVLGHDNFDWQAVFRPRLTIIDQPGHLMGSKAAEVLIARVNGTLEGPAQRIVLNAELVVRESCGVYQGHQPALVPIGTPTTNTDR
jgi:LacI family transcriptional regulator